MNIIQLKQEVDKLLESSSYDDYLFDNKLSFIKDFIRKSLSPNLTSIEDKFYVEEFKREFEKAINEKDDNLSKIINEIASFAVSGIYNNKEETIERLGKKYIDHRDREVQDIKHEGTGNFIVELVESSYLRDELIANATESPNNIIPKNWRQIVVDVINQPYRSFKGFYSTNEYCRIYNEYNEIKNPKLVSDQDLMAMLATKLAVLKNETINSSRNEIVLAIGSGIAAKIQIRRRSDIHKESWKDATGVYNLGEHEYFTILYQDGYVSSQIKSLFPKGYYFVAKDHIIEISYFPSSILVGTNHLFESIVDHPSQVMMDDEEEEERRRLDDDDFKYQKLRK